MRGYAASFILKRESLPKLKMGHLYVTHSESEAFFPVMSFIENDVAEQLGAANGKRGRLVTFRMKVPVAPWPLLGLLGASEGPSGEGEMRSITIGREFFLTALKDYSDWPIKWWREVVQNAVDAGGKNVALGATENPDGTFTVYCDDDGSGMDEDTVLNKFLVLGATTKIAGGGAAGGFGKAKELILLPWIRWSIHTRDTLINGAGIEYRVSRADMRRGTRLEVVMPADQRTDGPIARGFLEKCNLPGIAFTVDGKTARANLQPGGEPIKELEGKALFYFVKSDVPQSYMYIRTKGLFMFTRYVGELPGFLLAELTAPSIEILTANRDGFRDYYMGRAVDDLATKIAKDNLSAIEASKGLIRKKYEGLGKFKAKSRAAQLLSVIGPTDHGSLKSADLEEVVARVGDYAQGEEQMLATSLPSKETAAAMLDLKFNGSYHVEAALKQLVWQPDFYLVNNIDNFKIPKKFYPETMTPTILKLAKSWVELCRYVLMQLGSDDRFGVGFIFSETTAAAALADQDREGIAETWLLLNPFKDMRRQEDTWRPAVDPDLKWLYAAAIHECTHVVDDLRDHDESFSSALTRNVARCADGYRKIRQIVGGVRMRGGPEID